MTKILFYPFWERQLVFDGCTPCQTYKEKPCVCYYYYNTLYYCELYYVLSLANQFKKFFKLPKVRIV